jgi:hypothetical protein
MKVIIPGLQTFIFGRYGSLLAFLILAMLLQPFVDTRIGKLVLEVFFIAVLFSGLRTIDIKKGFFQFEVILLIVSLVIGMTGSLLDNQILFSIGLAGRVVFLVLVALTILYDLFLAQEVTGDTLAGAVCVYLLIALIWGYGYLLVEFASPGSYSFTLGHERMNLWIAKEFFPFFYFSLVTMTTVGYGDMAPVTKSAQILATLEALIGQIYLTILVARLVGMHLMYRQVNKK